jgi:pimeloyl-ACP methyl ester carboxylesterase
MADPSSDRRHFLVGGAIVAGAAMVAGARRANALPSALMGNAEPLRAIPMPVQVKAIEDVLHLPDADIGYWDTGGAGEAIFLLHPMTGSAKVWGHQQPVLAKAGYRVISYSRRGYIGSSAGDRAKPGSGAEDLLALVDHLKVERFHAVGSAGGAFVGAAFAMQWPERLRSLTLACSVVRVENPETAKLIEGLSLKAFAGLPADLRELGPSYRALDPGGHAAWLELEEHSRGGHPVFDQPAGMAVTAAMLAKLAVPTLLMAGDADLIAPPPIVRSLAVLIPGSELAVLTESGHSGYWERPDQFNATLIDFIRRRGRK